MKINPIMISRALAFLAIALAGAVLIYAVFFFPQPMSKPTGNDAKEASADCYEIAAQRKDWPEVRAMGRDNFISVTECDRILKLIDIEKQKQFDARKRAALDELNGVKK